MSLAELDADVERDLRRRIEKLERINSALMKHVERITDQSQGAYSLFQTAIMLDGRVRGRTEELTLLMDRLERSNEALSHAKNEAEQANGSKTRFLAAASHDLQQPLSATRLFVAALKDMPLETAAASIVGRIERGLETIEDTIKSLLDISKLDAGIVEPQFAPVSMREILSELDADYQHLAEQKGIRLTVRCQADMVIESDGALLRRVLGNLVSNAFRYTRDGGVLVGARRRDGQCRIDVVDTGCGIPAHEHQLIFEEFFRGQGDASAVTGMGLGLSIVRRLVQTLGHEISFTSQVERGTWFKIAAPLSHHAVRSPARETEVGALQLQGRKVLMVENDQPTLQAMQSLLGGWGLDLHAYGDPASLFASAADWADVEMIIADYHLGADLSGLEVVAKIRELRQHRLPALITTADRSDDTGALVANQSCALLHKPVKPAQLRSLLSYLLA